LGIEFDRITFGKCGQRFVGSIIEQKSFSQQKLSFGLRGAAVFFQPGTDSGCGISTKTVLYHFRGDSEIFGQFGRSGEKRKMKKEERDEEFHRPERIFPVALVGCLARS
jgi:hypothetical protein